MGVGHYKRKRYAALWAVLACLSLAAPALADGDPSRDLPAKRARVEQQMKRVRAEILRKQVGLEPAKAAEVERVLDKYAPERQKLLKELREQRRNLKLLLDRDSNDQQAYERAIRGLREAQEQLTLQRRRELDELARALTPKQQAKLARALWQMRRKLKKQLNQEPEE